MQPLQLLQLQMVQQRRLQLRLYPASWCDTMQGLAHGPVLQDCDQAGGHGGGHPPLLAETVRPGSAALLMTEGLHSDFLYCSLSLLSRLSLGFHNEQ